MKRDPSLDALLDLDGQVLVVDPASNHWVRFIVRRVPATDAKPHGLDYALSLHGPNGERLEGFHNALRVRMDAAPDEPRPRPQDHTNRSKTQLPYQYHDPSTLSPHIS